LIGVLFVIPGFLKAYQLYIYFSGTYLVNRSQNRCEYFGYLGLRGPKHL